MDDPTPPSKPHDRNHLDPDGPNFQQQTELYRLRAEDFERNFLSFRSVEWQLAFQTYAGYAMVGAGLVAINSSKSDELFPPTPSAIALVMLAMIFWASVFCQFQIQRRLHFTRTMQNTYLDRLHEVLAPKLPLPTGAVVPSFQKWWAFVPQLLINFATVFAITAYILRATRWCWCG